MKKKLRRRVFGSPKGRRLHLLEGYAEKDRRRELADPGDDVQDARELFGGETPECMKERERRKEKELLKKWMEKDFDVL